MNEQEKTKIITRKEAKAQGLKRYFTGEPCKHGHVAYRNIYKRCCECAKKYAKLEKYKAYQKEYQKEYAKSEKYKAYQKEYQKEYAKSEKYKASQKEHRESEAFTRSQIKRNLGVNPPEELVKANHANRLIKRFIKQQKQNQ